MVTRSFGRWLETKRLSYFIEYSGHIRIGYLRYLPCIVQTISGTYLPSIAYTISGTYLPSIVYTIYGRYIPSIVYTIYGKYLPSIVYTFLTTFYR